MYNLKYVFLFIFIAISQLTFGQEAEESKTSPSDSVTTDLSIISTDTTVQDGDSLLVEEPKGDLSSKINYVSQDSFNIDLVHQRVHLFKNAKITYENIEVTGEYIMIDFLNETVFARPGIDSTGKVIGRPVFKQGNENYTTDSMQYNFATEKAIIYNVITEQGGGFLLGDKVKKNQYNELFVAEGKFCPCETPVAGTYIKSNKIKVIPNKKILTGPAQLYVGDVPTPLFLPFAMFPVPKEKASGIRIPSYGEEQRRGFYLRNGGYYWAISDYMDLDVLGSIYSKGGHGVNVTSNYRKRYKYNGNMNFSYEKIVSGEEEDSVALNTFWIRWSHTPQTKGSSRFSANVNAGTSSYNENVVQSVERNTTASFSSNVTYSKTFTGTPLSMALSARHNQNVASGVVNLTLPDFSLNLNRITPFKNISGGGGKDWYKNINFSYRFNSTMQISNAAVSRNPGFKVANENPLNDSIVAFNLDNADILLDRAKIGGKHIIPISTTMKLFKHFTISPNFSYQELWYPNKMEYTFIEAENAVRIDTIEQFSRAYSFSGGIGFNTNIYGTYNVRNKRVQAIRHTIRPSLTFSFSPDFSDEKYGFYQNVKTDTSGTTKLVSRYNGYIYGSPALGESSIIGLSISNNLEMKVLKKNDTTGKATKVSLIDNLGLTTSYNMLADSFNLSNINLSLRTRLIDNKIDFSTSAILDPYTYVLNEEISYRPDGTRIVDQRRISKFAWQTGNGIGQITSARLSLGTNLSPKKKGKERTGRQNETETPQEDDLNIQDEERLQNTTEDIGYINGDPGLYVDFDVPWTLRISYTLNYRKNGYQQAEITQGIRFSGSLSITPKWNIGFSSGYDIAKKEFTQTRLDITRDLNCWMMVLNWTPFGRYTSYSFAVRIKSALLKDLKYQKRQSFFDQ